MNGKHKNQIAEKLYKLQFSPDLCLLLLFLVPSLSLLFPFTQRAIIFAPLIFAAQIIVAVIYICLSEHKTRAARFVVPFLILTLVLWLVLSPYRPAVISLPW